VKLRADFLGKIGQDKVIGLALISLSLDFTPLLIHEKNAFFMFCITIVLIVTFQAK
jgi:hypothetical protein